MAKRIHFLVCFLLFFTFYSKGQNISNIVAGYVPAIDRIEVQFDFDSKDSITPIPYKVYLQSTANLRNIEIKQELIHGINILQIKPGIQQYFQIDVSKISIPSGDYAINFIPLNKQVSEPVSTPSLVEKKEQMQVSKEQSKNVKIVKQEETKINIITNFKSNFLSIGITPVDLSGKQSSKTFTIQYGKLFGNYGLAMSFKYAFGSSISTSYESDNFQITNYITSTKYYKFNGNYATNRLAIIPSALLHLTDQLLVNIGLGYGKRELFWGIDEYSMAGTPTSTNWSKNMNASQSGVELEGGIKYIGNKLNLHIGYNYLGLIKLKGQGTFSDVWLGIGYNF